MNLTAYGQPSNDKVLITREEQRNCIKWYSENLYKDSVIITLDEVIGYKDTVINVQRVQNKAITDSLNILRLDYTKEQKKVRTNRRIAIGGISAFILAVGALFLLN